jgi:hypothetical protein
MKTPKRDGQKAGSFSKWAPPDHEPTALLLTLICMVPYNLRPLYGNVTNFVQGITGLKECRTLSSVFPLYLNIRQRSEIGPEFLRTGLRKHRGQNGTNYGADLLKERC